MSLEKVKEESTMANARMRTNAVKDTAEVNEKVEPKASKKVFGIVDNCELLNVRATASTDGEVVKVINRGTKLEINEAESTNEFYKVKNKSCDGFCMKDFITVE